MKTNSTFKKLKNHWL